jgi:putative FmdB family regulatory protein
MPLYEYYCSSCDGVFEELHSIREAGEPQPCPLCDHDSQRIMPTNFSAFTFRDGMPRRIPDDFKYWHHDGRKTKTMNKGGVPMNEHSELYRPPPRRRPTSAEREEMREIAHLKSRHAKMMHESGTPIAIGQDGKPLLSPKLGASGHVSGADERRSRSQ